MAPSLLGLFLPFQACVVGSTPLVPAPILLITTGLLRREQPMPTPSPSPTTSPTRLSSSPNMNSAQKEGGESITTNGAASLPLYWNRELSTQQSFDRSLPILRKAYIIALSDPQDPANQALQQLDLERDGACLVQMGTKVSDFDLDRLRQLPVNVIFVSDKYAREPLAQLIEALPETLQWIHSRSAGIDSIVSPALQDFPCVVTNAKGTFSSTLSEYTLMACSYFAKDLPRLLQNQRDKNWDPYVIRELRGQTLGVIGYGDIGRAAARLAVAYGMRIVALRRNPAPDPLCDVMYGNDPASLHQLLAESDYVLCAMPLTRETRGMIRREHFRSMKSSAVFINVGRGPIVEEDELIAALQQGQIRGAALDVFATEPLPSTSPLWRLPQVLLSPHNMDRTATFMNESTEFFVRENVPRFVRGLPLLNPVNPSAGY